MLFSDFEEATVTLVTNLDNAIDKLSKYSSKPPLYRSYSNVLGFDSMKFAIDVGNKGVLSDSAVFFTSTDIYDPNDDLRVIILKKQIGSSIRKIRYNRRKRSSVS